MNDSVWHVLLVIIGIAIGVAGGYVAFPQIREARRLREQLDQLLQEHESYKSSVNAHFRKTADLVGEMTKSYAAVYDHLAGGARRFCDDAGAESQLPFAPLPGALASPVIETAAEEAADAAPDSFVADEARMDGEASAPAVDSAPEAATGTEAEQRAAS